MADDEKVDVLANTEIEKITRLTKSFMRKPAPTFWCTYFLIGQRFFDTLF
jgi:hypothetical protein